MPADRVRRAAPHPQHLPLPQHPPRPPRRHTARLPGILLAVLLALFGGSGAVAHQPDVHGAPAQGQSAGSTYHQDPAQHFKGAIAHPAHAATHAPLPLLPAVGTQEHGPHDGFVLPQRPELSASHLAHRTPRHGRAPPAAQAPLI